MTVEQHSSTARASTYGWLQWLLAGGVLAALILSGVAAWLSDSLSHWVRTSGWLLDMVDTWKWPLIALSLVPSGPNGFAMITPPLTPSRTDPLDPS